MTSHYILFQVTNDLWVAIERAYPYAIGEPFKPGNLSDLGTAIATGSTENEVRQKLDDYLKEEDAVEDRQRKQERLALVGCPPQPVVLLAEFLDTAFSFIRRGWTQVGKAIDRQGVQVDPCGERAYKWNLGGALSAAEGHYLRQGYSQEELPDRNAWVLLYLCAVSLGFKPELTKDEALLAIAKHPTDVRKYGIIECWALNRWHRQVTTTIIHVIDVFDMAIYHAKKTNPPASEDTPTEE